MYIYRDIYLSHIWSCVEPGGGVNDPCGSPSYSGYSVFLRKQKFIFVCYKDSKYWYEFCAWQVIE